MAATGKSSPRRQGATGADTTASAIAPLITGGIYRSTAASVSATSDATIHLTDAYGRQEVLINTGSLNEVTNIATLGGQAPQWDNTDKLAVSLYGKGSAAGDTELPVFSNTYPGIVDPVTSTPTAYNVTLTTAASEYSQELPANTKGFEFQCRTAYDVRFAYVTGKVAGPTAPYLTLKAGSEYYKENVKLASTTLYLASAQAGVVVEITAWA